MFKKIGISLLLVCVMLISTSNVAAIVTAYANSEEACTTIAECRELQRRARHNIATIIEQEEELGEEIAEVQAEISTLRSDISYLETTIRTLEAEILELEAEITDLATDTALNLEILDETEAGIDVLISAIAGRMRLAQRANNRNSILVMLSEAEDLTTFVQVIRRLSRIATDDAVLMDELTALIEFQENLLIELSEQQEGLVARRETRHTRVAEVEVEQANLEVAQYALMEQEAQMRAMYQLLSEDRMSEEEMLAMATEIEEILERTPPPPIVTPEEPPATDASPTHNDTSVAEAPGANNDTASTQLPPTNNEASGAGSPPANNNTSSNNSPPANNNTSSNNSSANNNNSSTNQAPPTSSGLAHPMPGARVTSEFGPRWGRHHAGIDLVVVGNPQAPILAAAAGTVIISEWHDSMGWYVVLSHHINGSRVDTLYAHLRYAPPVSVGDAVTQGQVIGTKGNTGNSFGAHLHFEVHPGGFAWVQNRGVDPRGWINF